MLSICKRNIKEDAESFWLSSSYLGPFPLLPSAGTGKLYIPATHSEDRVREISGLFVNTPILLGAAVQEDGDGIQHGGRKKLTTIGP